MLTDMTDMKALPILKASKNHKPLQNHAKRTRALPSSRDCVHNALHSNQIALAKSFQTKTTDSFCHMPHTSICVDQKRSDVTYHKADYFENNES